MRVAGYIRVSTDEQAKEGNSLFEQEDSIRAHCRSMQWEEPILFIDDGYSAYEMNRPHLTKMLDGIKNKEFDIVVVTKLDRLSRKLLNTLTMMEYLEKYRCYFMSLSERHIDTTTPTGRMMLQLLGTFAEFERERIRERVRDNLLSLAKQGKLYGKPAYGYNVNDGIYEVNIEESLIVKSVFRWTLDGFDEDPLKKPAGPLAIASRLNQLDIPTKNNTKWDERRIRAMLSLETYIGQFIYNRKYRKGTIEVTRPEEEWIVTEVHHEPIIDIGTFQKVQSLLNNRKTASRRYHNDERYLLSGLVYCTHCGEKMNGREVKRPHNTKSPKLEYRYLCSGYAKKGICFFHSIPRDDLEKMILDDIKQMSKMSLSRLTKIMVSEPEKTISERDLLVAKLNKVDHRMQKQIEAWEKELISDHDLKLARERIDDERQSVQHAIKGYDQAAAASEQMKVQNKAKQLLKDILGADRIKAKQSIAQIIQRIEITDGSHVLPYFRT